MWMAFGSRIIHLTISGTLKKPLPDRPDTIDYVDHGTGFIVSPDGLVLTAAHLIPNPELFDEYGYKIEGRIPVVDMDSMTAAPPVHTLMVISGNNPRPAFDAGLLRISDASGPWPFLRLCNSYKRGRGITFPILGYAGGDYLLTSNEGAVAAGEGTYTNILLDTSINGGNSGGPVFNENDQVFGMAVAIRTIDGHRMSNSAEVVPMGKAIAALGEKANPLKGVSYDPDCNKELDTKLNTVKSIEVPIKSEIKFKKTCPALFSIFCTEAPQAIPYNVIGYVVEAPEGYKWVGHTSATSDQAVVNATIISEGTQVKIKNSQNFSRLSETALIHIDGELEAVLPKKMSGEVSDIRTIPFSKTLEIHTSGVTEKSYVDKIFAPEGFIFTEIVKIDYQSINNSPTNGAEINITNNGEALELKYSLRSGPSSSRWTGWIDAFITAKIVTKPKP